MEQEFLTELTTYVGFRVEHELVLAELKPHLEPSFPSIVERFYDAILANPGALEVFTEGRAQVERQKTFLHGWLYGVFGGRYDVEYLRTRARIGRTHVRIRLDQRYAIGGMSIVRGGLHEALSAVAVSSETRALGHAAIDKILDIELAIMARTYAEDYSARLRDIERLATLGQLAGFIGHELRNPLAVMETSLHLLNKRLPADENLTRHSRRLSEQLRISANIISSLLDLARDRPLERTPVDVSALLASAIDSVSVPSEVVLDKEVASLPMARVDEKQLRQLVVNLVTNALQALTAEGREPRIRVGANADRDALLLSVDDSGPGIPEHFQARLFEPLATTRQKGLGLGLALCRRIVEKHGGDIRALRSPLGGARFEARFPGAFPP